METQSFDCSIGQIDEKIEDINLQQKNIMEIKLASEKSIPPLRIFWSFCKALSLAIKNLIAKEHKKEG